MMIAAPADSDKCYKAQRPEMTPARNGEMMSDNWWGTAG